MSGSASIDDLLAEMRAPKKPVRLPEDWIVTPELYSWGKSTWRLEPWQMDVAADMMRAWADENGHLAKGKKKDWNRTFKVTWVAGGIDKLRRMPKPAVPEEQAEVEEEQIVKALALDIRGKKPEPYYCASRWPRWTDVPKAWMDKALAFISKTYGPMEAFA